MQLLQTILGTKKQPQIARKFIKDYKREILLKQGRDQVKKLLQLGQHMPVALG